MTDEQDPEANKIHQLAYAAKSLAFHSGEAVPSDEQLMRAAISYVTTQGMPPELAVCIIASNFMPDQDGAAPAWLDLIAAQLPNPADAVREMVAGNRRALGLPPQEGEATP